MSTRSNCIVCGSKSIKDIINLGWQPFADTFIPKKNKNKLEKLYPLVCSLCKNCKNIQLKFVTDAFERYNNFEYSYTSANSNFSRRHWDEFYKKTRNFINLDKNSNILEIGCNDCYLLNKYKTHTKNLYGIDASKKMVDYSRKKYKLKVFHNLFDSKIVKFFLSKKIKFKIIIANNVFNHMNNPNLCLKNIYKVLDTNGVFIFEVPYWLDTIKSMRYDQIYHEHVTYFTLQSAYNLLKKNDFNIELVSIENYHGKSLRIIAKKKYTGLNLKFQKFINSERAIGLFDTKQYELFSKKINESRNKLIKKIISLKSKGKKIIFIGAAAKSNTFINFHKLDFNTINYITDTSKSKINKLTPMSRIIIKHDDELKKEKNAYVMILIWNMKTIIVNKLRLINRNLKFL